MLNFSSKILINSYDYNLFQFTEFNFIFFAIVFVVKLSGINQEPFFISNLIEIIFVPFDVVTIF